MREIVLRDAILEDEQGICNVCTADNWYIDGNYIQSDYIYKVIQQIYTIDRVRQEIMERIEVGMNLETI